MWIMKSKLQYIDCNGRCVIIIFSGLDLRSSWAGIRDQILFCIERVCHNLRGLLWSLIRAGEDLFFSRSNQNLGSFMGYKHRAFLLHVGNTLFVAPINIHKYINLWHQDHHPSTSTNNSSSGGARPHWIWERSQSLPCSPRGSREQVGMWALQ